MPEDRREAAIMFTDIIGFTSLMVQDEEKTLDLLVKNNTIQKPLINKYSGTFIKDLGDGTLSAFPNAEDAVKCAVEIQSHIKKELTFKLRIGIHLGDVIFRDDDVFGNSVNIAARLETTAAPGTIMISGEVNKFAQNIPEITPTYLGKRDLKNIPAPINVYEINPDEKTDIIFDIDKSINSVIEGENEISFIVLPFTDLDQARDHKYLKDGLHKGLITNLSRIKKLKLVSRKSALALSQKHKTIIELGKELNIHYVLTGSVNTSDKEIFIEVQLVNGKTDKRIWSSTYEGSIKNIFNIQGKISRSVAGILDLEYLNEEFEEALGPDNDSLSVMEYYLRSREGIFDLSENGLERSIELLKEGLSKYGDNELLYAGLGTAYWQYLNLGYSKDPSYLHKMMECSDKIFALNPQSPEGFQLLGIINYKYGKVQLAAKMLKASLVSNNNDPVTLYFLATIYGNVGKNRSARLLARRLGEIDPAITMSKLSMGIIYYLDGKYIKAYNVVRRILKKDPDDAVILFYAGVFTASFKSKKEAFVYFDTNLKKNPDHLYTELGMLFKSGLKGAKQLVIQRISESVSDIAIGDEDLSIWMADIYAMIDEKALSIKWLRNATKKGFFNYNFIKNHDPFLKNIRKEKQFKELLEDVKEMGKAFKE